MQQEHSLNYLYYPLSSLSPYESTAIPFANRPFLVWVTPRFCFKVRLNVKPLLWYNLFLNYFMHIKLIFIWKVLHIVSFWKWEFLELSLYKWLIPEMSSSNLHSSVLWVQVVIATACHFSWSLTSESAYWNSLLCSYLYISSATTQLSWNKIQFPISCGISTCKYL